MWLVIVAASRTIYDVTDHGGRLACRQHADHLPFLVEREVKMLDAFFATSSSRVSRPTRRSRSAIRFCSARSFSAMEKMSVARCTKRRLHADTTCDASRCSRHTWAMVLLPVSTSSTTCTLKSGLNVRRFPMSVPFPGLIVQQGECPVPGDQYK